VPDESLTDHRLEVFSVRRRAIPHGSDVEMMDRTWPNDVPGLVRTLVEESEMLGIDPIYFLFLAPGMLLALWAQGRISTAYAEGSRIPSSSKPDW
jgi:hypothetical protein